MKQMDVLETIAWAEKHFGSLQTGRTIRRSQMLRLVDRGLAKSIGMAAVCDADGFILDPERFREGFVLTESGRSLLNGESNDG